MFASPRILIADDDNSVLRLLELRLVAAGYRCTCVGAGTDAVNALATNEYDLFVCDIVMPGNDNLGVVREALRIARSMPVILMTGYPMLESAIEALHLHVVEYLIKPIQIDDLLRRVEEALERPRILHAVEAARQENDRMSLELQRILQSVRMVMPVKIEGPTDGPERTEADLFSDATVLFEAQRRLLDETLQVLKATKTAFKSKDLGNLRKKIEAFLKKT